ncbi:conserved hypothetical protein [Ricinus communis]|uniref:Uncharacterized protein n=1 Tax=Ricinus communis TaxID=3988 RepID=B9TMC7_RICCO|nr:conserved hypothetical protein [Ricinus communis]
MNVPPLRERLQREQRAMCGLYRPTLRELASTRPPEFLQYSGMVVCRKRLRTVRSALSSACHRRHFLHQPSHGAPSAPPICNDPSRWPSSPVQMKEPIASTRLSPPTVHKAEAFGIDTTGHDPNIERNGQEAPSTFKVVRHRY